MKKFSYLLLASVLLCFSCKKDKKPEVGPDTSVGLHVVITGGNNQTDTVGNPLKDSVTVKVTNNGTPVSGYIVQFIRSGCQDQTITEKTTPANGQATYEWYLSGQTGDQSLDVILLDNNRNKKDSVLATATGIAGTHGWYRGGCLQNFPIGNVASLSSGRLLASSNSASYPYYSDNNAVSWQPLKTFSGNYQISKILAANSGVYIATQSDGLFYSSDNGQTWSTLSSTIPIGNFSDLAYTASGRLVYTCETGVFISTDNGQSWTEEDYGLPMGSATYPCEQLNGDLYIIGSDNEIYTLPNHTGTWVNIGSESNYLLSSVQSIFIDSKGNMFMGTPHDAPDNTAYLYESIDKGNSWSPVFTQTFASTSYASISNMSLINGTYYFSFAGLGVYATTNFVTYSNTSSQFGNLGVLTYTVSKNSTLVLGSPGFGVFYKMP